MRLSSTIVGATALALTLTAVRPAGAIAADADAPATAPMRTAALTPADMPALKARVAARQAMRDDRPAPAEAEAPASPRAEAPARLATLSTGTGQLMKLPRPISGVFIADDKIADVQVKSPTQLYLFAKSVGETSVFATDRSGAVVWSSAVRVGNNIAGVPAMLRMAMPEADIQVVPMNGMVLLNGTVLGARDADEAQRLVELYTGGATPVLNHLKVATPQQVMLQVKIAEVSRSVARNIGVNLLNRANGANPIFGIIQGNAGKITTNVGAQDPASGAMNGQTIAAIQQLAGTTLGIAGHAFGADLLATLQLYEQDGLVSTLAEPNLVALSGETATFLAGGEIPIPQSEGLGAVSVQFKQYGVSLSFTPTVLTAGRIALRVRPEVSEITDAGSVKLNGFTIPGLTTRRADTTVELGSGQSFVIGGLLQNNHNNNTDRAPLLGDLPIIGALFRSNAFRKDETELMIVVTPYIVKPVDAAKIALPTDGYRSATPLQRVLLGRMQDGDGAPRPTPVPAPPPAPPAMPATKPEAR